MEYAGGCWFYKKCWIYVDFLKASSKGKLEETLKGRVKELEVDLMEAKRTSE